VASEPPGGPRQGSASSVPNVAGSRRGEVGLVRIRPGLSGDFEQVRAFCQNTFHWGDYIPEVYLDWVTSDQGRVLVAEVGQGVVGLVHVDMPGVSEAWFEGMRVHPGFRRQGLAAQLTQAALAAARQLGASVARLAIASENHASHQLAHRTGFSFLDKMEEYMVSGREGEARPAVHDDLETLTQLAKAKSWLPGRPVLVGAGWRWWEASRQGLEKLLDREMLWTNGQAWAVLDYLEFEEDEITIHSPTGDESAVVALVGGMLARAGAGKSRARVVVPALQQLAPPGWEGPGESEHIYERWLGDGA